MGLAIALVLESGSVPKDMGIEAWQVWEVLAVKKAA